MTRKALVIAVLSVVMSAHMTACSSSSSKDDSSVAESNDETFAEEGEGDFAEAPKDASADTPPADQAVTSDAKPEDNAGDLSLEGDQAQAAASNADAPPADAPAADAPAASAASTDVAATDAKPTDELSLDDAGTPPADTAATTPPATENITDNPATPSDAGVFDAPKPTEVAAAEPTPAPEPQPEPAPVEAPVESPAPKVAASSVSYAPLMKVKDSAFTGPGGATLNRVYIARPKDTAKSVATKVYGDSKRSKELVKWNPVLKRGVRAGDKIYYSSAANPSDSKMMNYYEEAGVAPQTYVSKDGDNLRNVSKTLLGFKDAWKEVWETNPSVESKGRIPAGLSVSYWPDMGAPVNTMASTKTPPATSGGMPTSLPDAAPQVPAQQASMPPTSAATTAQPDPFNAPPPQATPPSQAVADNGMNPDPLAPPPPNDAAAQAANVPPAAAGTTAQTDPLAPPAAASQAAAPPPAVVKAPKAKKATVAAAQDEGGMDQDTTMALLVGGVLLVAAAILFVVIRKNRAKRMDLGQTQV